MVHALIIIAIIIYFISLICCIIEVVDREINADILSISIILCPIVNTVVSIRCVNWKDTMLRLRKK